MNADGGPSCSPNSACSPTDSKRVLGGPDWHEASAGVSLDRHCVHAPEIPDDAVDMHTGRGQEIGRGIERFVTEGAGVDPELESRERRWRAELLAQLGLPAEER